MSLYFSVSYMYIKVHIPQLTVLVYSSSLPLGATAQGELWFPEQSASILLSIQG
jgi:hypothetical protein